MTTLPTVPGPVAAAAHHGSYCPKLCNHACPVLAATGRDDAQPWSFHRTVHDLASGRLPLEQVGGRLDACTGCHACRVPCAFDQDVPEQVRAGRAALVDAGLTPEPARAALDRVAAGRSPFPDAPPAVRQQRTGAPAVLVAGCRDDDATVAAVAELLSPAMGQLDVVAPEGCCGGTLDDLGARGAAAERVEHLRSRLDGAATVVVLDPHCLGASRAAAPPDAAVVDAVSAVAAVVDADGHGPEAGALGAVTFHDPCLLARDEGVVEPPRRLLAALGAEVVEPEGHGTSTVCSGAGMALDIVDADAAHATAVRRAEQVAVTGMPVVTACSGARHRLAAAGIEVHDLFQLVAAHLRARPHDDPPTTPELP